jgi:hypothetical protein
VRICRPATFCENRRVKDLNACKKIREEADSAVVNLPKVSVPTTLSVSDELTLFEGARMIHHLAK